MTDLKVKSPFEGRLPVTHSNVSLSEMDAGWITSLMPFAGQKKAASDALKIAHGMAFPMPGRATGRAGGRAIWSGQGQAFLLGPKADISLSETTAMTDQSDGWVVMVLEGAGARDVLARLCPLDFRPQVFKRGHTARSLIGHMNASVTRIGAQAYMIMIFRSVALTAVHEITDAMKSTAAQ